MIEFADAHDEGKLLVRMDYGIIDDNPNSTNSGIKPVGVHINYKNKDIDSNHYLAVGGYYNKNSGSIVFRTTDINEVEHLFNNDLFKQGNAYKYELLSVKL